MKISKTKNATLLMNNGTKHIINKFQNLEKCFKRLIDNNIHFKLRITKEDNVLCYHLKITYIDKLFFDYARYHHLEINYETSIRRQLRQFLKNAKEFKSLLKEKDKYLVNEKV